MVVNQSEIINNTTVHTNVQISEHLSDILKSIPTEPGCYLMKDCADRILYIGKSKNLRNRVKSYFQIKSDHSPRIRLMIKQTRDIEIIITDNEREALTLESNLIKTNKPYFNILLKDDKKYPYLCITWSDKYPRIYITRKRRNRNKLDRYYGPYVDVGLLRSTLFHVKRLFPLRQRPRPLYKDRTCINYSIGRCPGVCQEKLTSTEYHKTIEKVAMIFQGRTEELKELLTLQMYKYSKREEFELAAKIRDQINGLDQLTGEQKMTVTDSSVSRDVIGIASNSKMASIQIFQMRSGKLIGRLGYIADSEGINDEIVLQKIIEEHYSLVDPVEIASQILVQYALPQAELIAEWLTEIKTQKVQLIKPLRGKKSDLVDLVTRNATFELSRITNSHEKQLLALEDLAQLLELNELPRRIEGYDISHIQGSDAVGSQVVFIDGLPAKQHYRRYNIKSSAVHLGHSDDYMSLAEVIRRRFKRWSRAKSELDDFEQLKHREISTLHLDGMNDWPDLICIDGGKGQLSAVLEALRELKLEEDVNICSLAKQQESVFLPGEHEPIRSDKNQLGIILLRRLRDEAHRFAITHHREKRTKRMNKSRLSEIPGLGPRRIKELLSHFNSVDAIQLASVKELEATPTLGKRCAKDVWTFFHPSSD